VDEMVSGLDFKLDAEKPLSHKIIAILQFSVYKMKKRAVNSFGKCVK
jgi:hypothetical protein